VQQSGGTVAAAVRTAEEQKVPFMVIVGDREVADGSVSVRARGGQRLGTMGSGEFTDRLVRVVATKQREADLIG
jgi:threonyl-tRNA synthetase